MSKRFELTQDGYVLDHAGDSGITTPVIALPAVARPMLEERTAYGIVRYSWPIGKPHATWDHAMACLQALVDAANEVQA